MENNLVFVSSEFRDELLVKEYLDNFNIVTNEFNPLTTNYENVFFIIDIEGISQDIKKTMADALDNQMSIFIVINNIDDLFKNGASVEEFQDKLLEIFMQCNDIVKSSNCLDKENKQISFEKGNITFGSVKNNWLNSMPVMIKTGVNIADMKNYCNNSMQDELSQKIPFKETILDMISN